MVRTILAWILRPFTERNKGNLRLAFGAFCLSLVIWVFNALNKEIEATISIPIQLRYNSKSYAPVGKVPSHFKAIIRGHGWQVMKAVALEKPKPMVVWVKHPGLHSKFDTIVFREYIEAKIAHVRVRKVLIEGLTFPFEIRSHKWLKMEIDTSTLSVAKGYEMDSIITFEPDRVLVSGPQSIVREINDTLSISIPYKDIDRNFDESFKLSYFLHSPNLELSHEKIKVQFKVKKRRLAHAGD